MLFFETQCISVICFSNSDNTGADDIAEAVCWSDSVCIHVYTRSPGLGITPVLGSGFLQRRSGGHTSALSSTVRVD